MRLIDRIRRPSTLRGVTARFAIGTAVATWTLYLLMAGIRCITYGFPYPAMVMERHALSAAFAIVLSVGLHALLARRDDADLWRQLQLALLISIPPASMLSFVNYNVMFVFGPPSYLRAMDMDPHLTFLGKILYSAADNYFIFAAWSVLSVAVGREMRVRETLRRAAVAEAATRLAELRALRLQLDPHFLFNALNTVSGLILDKDTIAADRALDALSSFLRATLSADKASDIPLREELHLQMLYLRIEQARFGERLRVVTDVSPASLDCLVPALILQPIVENAMRHGVARTRRPVTVSIRAERQRDMLRIVVENDGPADPSCGDRGIGIGNVEQRLALRYETAATFRFHRRQEGGVRNELVIPICPVRPDPRLSAALS